MAAETGSAREEAERLVAAVLAMAGQSTDEGTGARLRDGLGNLGDTVSGLVGKLTDASGGARTPDDDAPRHVRYGWATGSLECCVCPVCRAIAGMRDPNPRSAERLATGAGDMAMGVASLMRGLSTVAGAVRPAARPAPPPPARRPAPDPDTAWSAATRTGRAEEPEPPVDEDESPWAAATRAEARVAAAARAAEKARETAAEKAREAAAAEAREAAAAEARAAAERARTAGAADEAPAENPAPAALRGPRPGEDVWAAATATGEVGMAGRTRVDHDEAGDEAPGRS